MMINRNNICGTNIHVNVFSKFLDSMGDSRGITPEQAFEEITKLVDSTRKKIIVKAVELGAGLLNTIKGAVDEQSVEYPNNVAEYDEQYDLGTMVTLYVETVGLMSLIANVALREECSEIPLRLLLS